MLLHSRVYPCSDEAPWLALVHGAGGSSVVADFFGVTDVMPATELDMEERQERIDDLYSLVLY